MIGIDEVEINDSLVLPRLRKKEFMNFKSSRSISANASWFKSSPDAGYEEQPLLVAYMGLNSTGQRYQRFVYGYLNFISDIGALIMSLYKGFLFLVTVLCSVKYKSKLI